MKGEHYWSVVKWIILGHCRRKGLPMNVAIYRWVDEQIEKSKERMHMRLAKAVQV